MEENEDSYPEEQDADDDKESDKEKDDDSDYSGATETKNEKRTLKTVLRSDKVETNADTAEKQNGRKARCDQKVK